MIKLPFFFWGGGLGGGGSNGYSDNMICLVDFFISWSSREVKQFFVQTIKKWRDIISSHLQQYAELVSYHGLIIVMHRPILSKELSTEEC